MANDGVDHAAPMFLTLQMILPILPLLAGLSEREFRIERPAGGMGHHIGANLHDAILAVELGNGWVLLVLLTIFFKAPLRDTMPTDCESGRGSAMKAGTSEGHGSAPVSTSSGRRFLDRVQSKADSYAHFESC
jgi:hypothetical protein